MIAFRGSLLPLCPSHCSLVWIELSWIRSRLVVVLLCVSSVRDYTCNVHFSAFRCRRCRCCPFFVSVRAVLQPVRSGANKKATRIPKPIVSLRLDSSLSRADDGLVTSRVVRSFVRSLIILFSVKQRGKMMMGRIVALSLIPPPLFSHSLPTTITRHYPIATASNPHLPCHSPVSPNAAAYTECCVPYPPPCTHPTQTRPGWPRRCHCINRWGLDSTIDFTIRQWILFAQRPHLAHSVLHNGLPALSRMDPS